MNLVQNERQGQEATFTLTIVDLCAKVPSRRRYSEEEAENIQSKVGRVVGFEQGRLQATCLAENLIGSTEDGVKHSSIFNRARRESKVKNQRNMQNQRAPENFIVIHASYSLIKRLRLSLCIPLNSFTAGDILRQLQANTR